MDITVCLSIPCYPATPEEKVYSGQMVVNGLRFGPVVKAKYVGGDETAQVKAVLQQLCIDLTRHILRGEENE